MKAYRFEFEPIEDPESWGWDVVEAPTYRDARRWIFETYPKEDYRINYIAELKYEREEEE